jgi:hypothetical protein
VTEFFELGKHFTTAAVSFVAYAPPHKSVSIGSQRPAASSASAQAIIRRTATGLAACACSMAAIEFVVRFNLGFVHIH